MTTVKATLEHISSEESNTNKYVFSYTDPFLGERFAIGVNMDNLADDESKDVENYLDQLQRCAVTSIKHNQMLAKMKNKALKAEDELVLLDALAYRELESTIPDVNVKVSFTKLKEG